MVSLSKKYLFLMMTLLLSLSFCSVIQVDTCNEGSFPMKKWTIELENPEEEAQREINFTLKVSCRIFNNGKELKISRLIDYLRVNGYLLAVYPMPEFKESTLQDGDYYSQSLEQTIPAISASGRYENTFTFVDNSNEIIGCFSAVFDLD